MPLRIGMSLGVAVLVGWYIRGRPETFWPLLTVAPAILFVLSLLLFLSWIVYGIKLKLLAALFRINLGWTEAVAVYVISVFFNYLLFQVGFASKGMYLKRQYDLSYSAFAAISSFQAVVVLLAAGMTGPILILGSTIPLGSSWPLLLFFVGVGVLGVIAFLIPTPLPSFRPSWLNPLIAFGEGWRNIQGQPEQIAKVMAVELFGMGLYAVRLYIAFRALGQDVSLTACGIMALSGVLSGFISLTPGNLVIQEGIAAFVAMAFGVAFQVGLAAAFLDRAVDLAWALAVGLVLTFLFAQRMGEIKSFRQAPPIRSEPKKWKYEA